MKKEQQVKTVKQKKTVNTDQKIQTGIRAGFGVDGTHNTN